MILRRVITHFKKQEWTAIALDFLIVVVGVFIGIQVSNWNAARGDRAEYGRALERLAAETKANRITVDTVGAQTTQALKNAGDALDALLSCTDSEENRKIVNAGLAQIRNTNGLYLRSDALKELTTSPRLLSQQSARERERFTDMMFYFNLIKSQSDFVEFHPLDKRFEDIPILSPGPRSSASSIFYGVEVPLLRPIVLNKPINIACQNDQLIKAFVTWERWQGDLPSLSAEVSNELDAIEAMLEDIRK